MCTDLRDNIFKEKELRMEEDKKQGSSELSGGAKAKLEQFIKTYDPINNRMLRQNGISKAIKGKIRDKRLPIPGTVISKVYKGTTINVKILDKRFEYDEKTYRSLSAIAGVVTGQHWNGYLFFGI